MSRIRKVIDECNAKNLAALKKASETSAIKRLQKVTGFGSRTYNHYVHAIDGFCTWLVENERLVSNPLNGLSRLNAQEDIRHKRRALSPEEFSQLVSSARSINKATQCYDGETRARIYITSYMTGLRRKEISSLRWRSFSFASVPSTLTVEAIDSKHRRKDVLPIHPKFEIMLHAWLGEMDLDQPHFPGLANRRTWKMVKEDLETVGIPYETPEGIADFHAAGRHSHITGLMRVGNNIADTIKLARHSDFRMTMNYTHVGIEDQAKALAAFRAPRMESPESAASVPAALATNGSPGAAPG